ncbi:MAG: SMC-Scp complex subunit ScpB [Chloroflexi bacterium]|nr:SMC-Scp complex subunit ScpB [Chloroflexota bacterium]
MVLSDLGRTIEALLYVADSPLNEQDLAQLLETDVASIQNALRQLEQALMEHGLRLQRSGNRVQLTTAPDTSKVIERYLGVEENSKLSPAALETLAIIAYKQPITRAQIEALRGVNCEGALHSLITRSLVAAVGRLEQVGRPVLYATTSEFLQYLGINALSELPELPAAVTPYLSYPAPG